MKTEKTIQELIIKESYHQNRSSEVDRLNKAFSDFADSISDIARRFVKEMIPIVIEANRVINKLELQKRKRDTLFVLKYSPQVHRASKEYPHLAYLARRSKKARVRKKNLKRLYKLGQRIESRW